MNIFGYGDDWDMPNLAVLENFDEQATKEWEWGKFTVPYFFMLLVWRNAFWHLYLYFLPLCFSRICVAFKKVLLIQGFLYNLLYLWIVTCIWWFSLSWSFKFNLLCFASKLCVFSVSIWSHVRNYIFLQFAAAMTMLRLGSVLLWKKLQIFLQLP